MTFLFLLIVGLLVWVSQVQGRVTTLEGLDAARTDELASLKARVEALSLSARAGSAAPAVEKAVPAVAAAATPPPTVRKAPAAEPAKPAATPAPPPLVPKPATTASTQPPPTPTQAAPAKAPAAAAPEAAAVPVAPPVPPPRPTPAVHPRPAATVPSKPAVAEAPPTTPFDWEELIGVRLFSWVAGIAMAFAAVFFLGYSIQHGWLQPPVRMAIGLLVGVGLLVVCELKAARNYPVTANAMDGAAIVILFSTFFASYRLWELIGPGTAFAMLALVTVVAVLLSIRRDSVFIALLGLVGGFSTPALLSTGRDNPFGLFGYLLLLNAGLGWVAYRKRWPALVALSLLCTTVYQWGWVATFLTPAKLPVAAGIFLAFPVLGFVSLGLAGRAGALDAKGGEPRGRWFEEAAALNGALPLLFALFMAGSPAYGEHPALLFGFLFCVDAGLFAIAVWRGQMLLHVLGAAATLVAFAAWMSTAYVPTGNLAGASYPSVLWFVSLFVVFYLGAGLAARHGRRRLDGPGRLAVYAAPLLLFAFAALTGIEPAVASPALPFSVLFGLLVACAAFAIAESDGLVYFIAAFLAVAAEGAWSVAFLSNERLVPALLVYAAFGLMTVAVPMAARRLGRALEPAQVGGVLVLASIGLLFFLSQESMADASLWGLALLLALLNVALIHEGRAAGLREIATAGGVLSWVVLGNWWLSGAATAQVVPALVVTAGFSLLMLAGQLWMRNDRADDEAQISLGLALVGHLFLVFVAAQPALSVPPWPMLAALAALDLGIGAAAVYTGRGEVHAVALALSQLILIVWVIANPESPWPLVSIVSAIGVAALGMAWSALAGRRVADAARRTRFHAAAAIALVLAQAVLLVASMTFGSPGPLALAGFHVLVLGCLLCLATFAGWLELAVLAAGLSGVAAVYWQASHGVPEQWKETLTLAVPLYAVFMAYPLALGRRVGRELSPHLAAVVASAWFFYVARQSLDAAGYGDVIGLLPVVQAALMGGLLAALLKVEPPSGRTLGRLALVAGTVLAFVTVAIPLQLDKQWITIGWALEGAALAWLFRRIPHRGLFWWSLALLAIVFARLALNPEVLVYHARSGVRIFNWYLYTYLTCAAAMLAGGWLLSKTDDAITPPLRASQVLPAAGTVLLFMLLNIEIADFYATGDTITFHLSAGLAQNLTYTLGWATFAVCLLAAGIALRSHAARIAAIVLLTVTVLKGFLSDVARLGGLYRVMSFVGLAVSLALVAIVLQRFVLAPKAREQQERKDR
jgi:uncharacterized membrane protein